MTPVRTCVVCRAKRDDTALHRAGRSGDGTWYLGRGPGRGLWWCQGPECAEDLRIGHVARALRAPVSERDLDAVRALETGRGRT